MQRNQATSSILENGADLTPKVSELAMRQRPNSQGLRKKQTFVPFLWPVALVLREGG
jgi:hypothetical protein